MNMAHAASRIPASTARTVTASNTPMWTVTDRRRSTRSTSAPVTATTSEPASATASVRTRSRMLVPVPHAPHGHDPARARRVVLDLLPQPSHVDGHSGLVAESPAPHVLQQFGPAERPPGVAHQEH